MTKKENNNLSTLINKKNFFDSKQISNEELIKDFEDRMELANEHYDKIYLESKNNPDIKKFSSCKEEFREIKSYIEQKGVFNKLINNLYFEAWISMLYSDVHALNLAPKTEKQLNEFNQKILAIDEDFDQLLTKKSNLDLQDSASIKYINDFEKSWRTKQDTLSGHAHYNYAEFLVEKSDLDALAYFEKASNFYKNAAAAAMGSHKSRLLKYREETNTRLIEIKTLLNNHNGHNSSKIPKIYLQRLSDSITSQWTIINGTATEKTISTQATKNFVPSQATKRKQEFNEKLICHNVKKTKKESIQEILNNFKDLNIDIDLAHLSNNAKSFDERKAIVHNNYAVYLIEDLIAEKNYSESEKLTSLKKAEQLLIKSVEFYKKVNLLEKKNIIEHCMDSIRLAQKDLEHNIQDSSPTKKAKCLTRPILPLSEKKYYEYQHTYSTRYAHKFFEDPSLLDNRQSSTQQHQKCHVRSNSLK